jgi:hypothetical protein
VKALLFAALAAIGLVLAAAAPASAAWVTRPVQRWDPYCGRYVVVEERYWVPDCYDHHHQHRRDYYPDRYLDRSYYPAYPGRGFSLDFGLTLPFRR